MTRSEMEVLIQAELATIPRGSISQNIYRAAYQQARLSGLADADDLGSPDAAHAIALEMVKRSDPSFRPQVS